MPLTLAMLQALPGLEALLLIGRGAVVAALFMPLVAFARPPAIVVSQVHNAPGWLPNHTYTAAATRPYTRVNAGPGWSPGTATWNPGRPLAAYQLVSTGSCTSGTAPPSGTGAAIADGSCTWKYLSPTDYVTITGWASDGPPWRAGAYGYRAFVASGTPLRAYVQTNIAGCTSASAPTGPGTRKNTDFDATFDGYVIASSGDGCKWVDVADVLYSSRKSYIPTQSYTAAQSATVNLASVYEAQLWNDREYVAGRNGEKSPIEIKHHNDTEGDQINLSWCASCGTASNPAGTAGHIVLMPAPGEGFADALKTSDPLAGYDPTKGVAILDPDPQRWPVYADALYVENGVKVIGLQLKSSHGAAFGSVFGHDNTETILGSILDGAGPYVVGFDGGSVVANSLVVAHGNIAGVACKYPCYVLHDTIVDPDRKGTFGAGTGTQWVFPNMVVADTAIFGFAHGAVYLDANRLDPRSRGNATDAPVGDAGTVSWIGGTTKPATIATMPGTLYGVAIAAAFVAPGSDWRPNPQGPLIGAGAAFGTFDPTCAPNQPRPPPCAGAQSDDATDIIGTARPHGSGHDIGAWQSPGNPPARRVRSRLPR